MEKITMDRTSKKTVQEGYDRYIRLKKLANLSEETIRGYEVCFRYFVNFFDASRPCSEITKDTIYDYIEHLQQNTEANPTTINTYLKALRTLLYYFMEEGYTKRFKIELLRVEKAVKETYTEEELEKLLRKPNIKKCSFSEYRTWVLSNYLFATGNRIRTALGVKIKDLDFENQLILLSTTKNKRQQIVPMSGQLSAVLQEYLLYRKGEPEDYLFCSTHGTQMTRDGATTVLYRYNKKRGVEKTSAHAYRHTFVKYWILNHGDSFRLQKLLGHQSMEMVRNYVEMFNDDLKRDYESFNPLDNFSKGRNKEAIKMKK